MREINDHRTVYPAKMIGRTDKHCQRFGQLHTHFVFPFRCNEPHRVVVSFRINNAVRRNEILLAFSFYTYTLMICSKLTYILECLCKFFGYNRLLQEIELRFGAPSSSENQYSDSGVKAQNIWDTDKGQVWAIYGTNLWAAYAPDKYEKGVNEVVVSYSINY